MSLVPACTLSFTGNGLAKDEDVLTDATTGAVTMHPWKAGSDAVWRLQFPGLDTTVGTWAMHVRSAVSSTDILLGSGLTGTQAITIIPNPTGADTTLVEFRIPAAGTSTMQLNGVGIAFVFDIEYTASGETDRLIEGSGTVTPEVTR